MKTTLRILLLAALALLADGRVAARTRFSLVNSYLKIDLGIVKCHFELSAGSENVRWA